MSQWLWIIAGVSALVGLVVSVRIGLFRATQVVDTSVTAQQYSFGTGDQAVRVWVLGDSTAAGTGVTNVSDTWHYQYLSTLADQYRFEVQNLAKNGETIADTLTQLDQVESADLLLISVGGNDLIKRTSQIALVGSANQLVDQSSQTAAKTIWITPGDIANDSLVPWPLNRIWGSGSQQLAHTVAEATEAYQSVTHIDMLRAESTVVSQDPARYHAADGLHLNSAGYMLWADIVSQHMELSEEL